MRPLYVADFRTPIPTKPPKPQNILYQDNFAAQMVELEMAIELADFDVVTLQKLMDFYSRAVDYFVQTQSSNYIYFKNRIKSLLLKPKVVELINAQDSRPRQGSNQSSQNGGRDTGNMTGRDAVSKPEPKQARAMTSRPNYEYYSKMDNFQLNKELSTAHQKKNVEEIVKNYANSHGIKEEVIKTSLMDQKNNLRKRIEERKTNSRSGTNNTSMLSVDKSRQERPKRFTELSVNVRPYPQSRQTIPKAVHGNGIPIEDEYNVYNKFRASVGEYCTAPVKTDNESLIEEEIIADR
jgi:hypothetical protein